MNNQFDTSEHCIIPNKISSKELNVKMVEAKLDKIVKVFKETCQKLEALDINDKDKFI